MLFDNGLPQNISDILRDKDQRVAKQKKIMSQNPQSSLVVVKLNIPGEIKYNYQIDQLFTEGFFELKKLFSKKGMNLGDEIIWRHPAGETSFLLIKKDLITVKKASLFFEKEFSLGRLFDVDVMNRSQGAISRVDLGEKQRKCLLCDQPAKECARSRRHSLNQLRSEIEREWRSYCK